MSKTTVLVGFHRTNSRRDWLDQALDSFPKDTPYMVLKNDGYDEWIEQTNRAAEQAETEFILIFGHDDQACPCFLGPMENLANSGLGADVVYPSMILTNEDMTQRLSDYPAQAFCGNRLQIWNYIPGCSLIRRDTFVKAGGYRNVLIQDWDLWVRLHKAGARFKPCPEAVMLYRQRGDSLNRLVEDKTFEEMRAEHGIPEPELKATFYPQATPATTYLRCQLPARHLPGQVVPGLEAVMDKGRIEFPWHRGTAVMQFAGDKYSALFALHMRNEGIRVLVEADDNYTAPWQNKKVFDRSGWTKQIGDGPHSVQGHRWIVENTDGVIVTTPWLANRYRKLNPNVYVCPNTIDPQDWPEPKKPDDGILRIVWFASRSHEEDIPLITRAFEWASQQPDVKVYAFGLDPGWKFPHGLGPWVDDLDAYRWHFHYFDIGVAPVRQTQMGLGRSDIKALEYSMGMVAPVLSDVAPYDSWTNGENCLKAKDARGFYEVIRHLVQHRDEVKQLAQAAREYTLRERTTAKQIDEWREAIDAV